MSSFLATPVSRDDSASPATSAGGSRQPLRDPLTALPGRALLEQRAAEALGRIDSSASTALVVLDLDRFKHVNETFGLRAGDELMCAVAARLELALAADEFLARFGGDEFAVLCERVNGERGAIAAAERMLRALDQPFATGDRPVFLTASIGITVASDRSVTPEALLRDAGIAARRAKERGGARYELFDEAMLRRVIERVNLEHDLRRGLDRDELTLFYQPIVCVDERRAVAMEALVRWQHPALGLVPPDAFMPVAEETGLIVGLGTWVITEACRQIGRWGLEGVDAPYVTVNVSRRQLLDSTLPDQIARILHHTGVAPERLGLELSESALIDDPGLSVGVLQQLDRLGVRLLLDGFGTGYSSLNLLKRLPLQALKVDRSFIAGITEGEEDRHILRAIVGLSTALGVDVIAEGVETIEQARAVRAVGCTQLQGYLVAPPAHAVGLEDPVTTARVRAEAIASAVAEQPHEPPPAPEEDSPAGPAVTLGEAASALGVSTSTLRRWADARRVRTERTAGGHRRFPVSEIRRLKQQTTAASRPVLRTAPLPPSRLPNLDLLLSGAAAEIADAATRALYERQRQGWFASDAGRSRLAQWAGELSAAARTGRYAEAADATRALLRQAHLAGTSLLERHMLVERYADLVVRALQQRDPVTSELLDTRRLFARLRQIALEDPFAAEEGRMAPSASAPLDPPGSPALAQGRRS